MKLKPSAHCSFVLTAPYRFALTALCSFTLVTSLATPAWSFEIDSFYKRNQQIKDSTELANQEINKKIQTAVTATNSCDIKELYTNVRNQINADSAGAGVIGGMERWAEKSTSVDKIDPPPAEESIYYGTSFESITSMGFWLKLYSSVKQNISSGVLKTKLAIRKLTSGSSDPMVLCKVPDSQKEQATKFVEMSKHQGPPGGGGPGGGRPDGPPPDMNGGGGPGGPDGPGGPGGPGGPPDMEGTKQFAASETGMCLKAAIGIKDSDKNGSLQAIIKVNNVRIGADKLGHFFDQGFDYFQKEYSIKDNKLVPQDKGLQTALDYGVSTEEGIFGYKATGVKSYGDLAANYGGSVFWQNLVSGSSPLVVCKNGKMEVAKKFDFKDYVTDAWDEGINCSEYKSQEMKDRVASNLKALKLTCPVEVAKCQDISKHYTGEVLEKILSPECKKHMTTSSKSDARGGVQ